MLNDKTFFLEDATGNFQLKGVELSEGDATISINGSEFENLTNLPVTRRENSAVYDLVLTGDEDVPGAEIRIEDQSTPPVFLPISITVSDFNLDLTEDLTEITNLIKATLAKNEPA